ncbi:Polyadenylate-binding protein [Actinidia chinensis var. chinensis]|uniref:Polyadenylate-binding protein n=1 Tax=Actinidia chinensis var. chinensis TaxID=1590841 RepID=A0A2R6PT31_ACTCC|nr:Polyadenylate-binding protein [Actinidia chinensis var. chinensis]
MLFGVKSTFDEELYTTKLERGPKMRELEREALRIAREIEGEETLDLHLAEERGFQLHGNFDINEETRFSSVFRGVDDTGYDENENILLDSRNIETFGSALGFAVSGPFTVLTRAKSNEGNQVPSCSSTMDEVQSSVSSTTRDLQRSTSSDHSVQLASEFLSKSSALDSESRIHENQFSGQHVGNNYIKESVEKQMLAEEEQMLKSEDLQSSLRAKKDGPSIRKLSPNATSYDRTSLGSSKCLEKMSLPSELSADAAPVKTHGASQSATSPGWPGSYASSTSEFGAVAPTSSCPGLSPSSSMGSFSSEKSTLNPHAKEFKLNPNAKSFMPSQTPLRPASPVSDGFSYFPAVSHMHGMPVGVGVGPSFAHQPVIFNPQVSPMQSPQAYFHPNGSQYAQQMILGHPRQVLYMSTYTPEMPYKGRDF